MHQCLLQNYHEYGVTYSINKNIFLEKFSLSLGRRQIETHCTDEKLTKGKIEIFGDCTKGCCS